VIVLVYKMESQEKSEDKSEDKGIEAEITTIETKDGKDKLFWKSWKPRGTIIGTVTFVHGQAEHCARYDAIFQRFAGSGIVVNCFDLRGHGQSSGKHGHSPFDACLEDISLIASKADPNLPHIIYGHSMGGLLSIHWILHRIQKGDLPRLDGAVITSPLIKLTKPIPAMKTLASFLNALSSSTTIKNGIDPGTISRDKEANELYAKDPFNRGLVSFQTVRDFMHAGDHVIENADKISIPILMLHGDADQITSHKASELFITKVSSKDQKIKIYKDCYHELHNEPREVREVVIQEIEEWILAHFKPSASE